MKNNSPSQRRYRAKRNAEYFRNSIVELDFYKRRIGELCEQFPKVFNKGLPLPLAIGTHLQLVEDTHFTEEEVGILLKIWVKRWEYKCMAASTGRRFDLQGNDVGFMEASELKGYIKATLALRPAKLRIFCKRYLKEVGRPGLICIPINERPELEIDHD